MRPIRNDKRAYETRESLSAPNPTKAKSRAEETEVKFEFWLEGHYVKRREKN